MDFISVMEWIGTVAFAASGAFVAIEKKLDYYGICILAIVTAIGGGIVRDLLINRDLPASLENPLYVIISLVTAFLIIVFYEKTEKITNLVNIADAIGLAAFVAVGAEVAVYQSKGTLFVIITMVVLTGTGGGILRDIFAQEIPDCFRKEVYASAAIAGAVVFWVVYPQIGITMAAYVTFGVTLIIRLVSMHKGWHLGRVLLSYERKDQRDKPSETTTENKPM